MQLLYAASSLNSISRQRSSGTQFSDIDKAQLSILSIPHGIYVEKSARCAVIRNMQIILEIATHRAAHALRKSWLLLSILSGFGESLPSTP